MATKKKTVKKAAAAPKKDKHQELLEACYKIMLRKEPTTVAALKRDLGIK